MGIQDRYQDYKEADDKVTNAVVEEEGKRLSRIWARLNGKDEASIKMAKEIEAKVKAFKEAEEWLKGNEDDPYYNRTLNAGAKYIYKEEKPMTNEKKEITTKQAVRALKRNFKRWCSDHFVLLAGIGTGAAAIGTYAIWNHLDKKVQNHNEQLNEALMNTLDAIEADYNSKPLTWFDSRGPVGDNNLCSTFILESANGKDEFKLTPQDLDILLESISENYNRDYDLLPTINNKMITHTYADGTTKVEFE